MGVMRALDIPRRRKGSGAEQADSCHPKMRNLFTFRISILLIALLVTVGTTASSAGQTSGSRVPAIAAADSVFAAGVRLFERGAYRDARGSFNRVVGNFQLNRYTSASALMAAKCAYRLDDFLTAQNELSSFLVTYPTSGYLDDALSTLRLADAAYARSTVEVVRMGIILSLHPDEVAETQTMFDGMRIGVYEHNKKAEGAPVQMLFRDTNSSPEQAASAVRDLAGRGVAFIVGALFSDQAIAAAQAADAERVVFMAPLATDERVTAGRRYAFQANPTISMRGRLMARFAVNGLLLKRFGIVAREDDQRISERLTDAFIEEASRLGAEINLISILPDDNAWLRIPEFLTSDTLDYVDALYIPVTAAEPEPVIGAILSSLDRIGVDVRVLGNSAWHDLPMMAHASKYLTTYSNDYYPTEDDSDRSSFSERYRALEGEEPNRLAFSGYDVVSFLLKTGIVLQERSLRKAILSAPPFTGLGSRIDFQGGNVNQAMFYHRYRDGVLALIR